MKWLFLLTLAACFFAVLVLADVQDGARAVEFVGTGLAVLIAAVVLSVRLGRFWVLIGAAVLAVLAGINGVLIAVEWWGGDTKSCPGEPNCVELAPPFSRGVPALAYIGGLFALGAVFVYLAIRTGRRRVATR